MKINIKKSIQIPASVDIVWNVLTDFRNETKYWTNIRDIVVLKEDGNRIERDATVGPPIFGMKTRQSITLTPRNSFHVSFTGDSVEGERLIRLSQGETGNTGVEVSWDLGIGEIPEFTQRIVENQLAKATDNALENISKVAESFKASN